MLFKKLLQRKKIRSSIQNEGHRTWFHLKRTVRAGMENNFTGENEPSKTIRQLKALIRPGQRLSGFRLTAV